MTDEQLKQIEAWYADPVRKLPRKVKRDVADLVAEVKRLRASPGVAIEPYVKALAKTPIGAGMLVGAAVGALLGATSESSKPNNAPVKPLAPFGALFIRCKAPFVSSPDYKGSATDRVTDADIFCTKPKGHDGLHCHEPWNKEFQ